MDFKMSDTLTRNQKEELDVLEKGESRRDRLWKESVKEAKAYLKNKDEIRFKIIALAEKCCSDIEGSRYTFGRFADEIGLARGTLYEWMLVKREVYDVLPKEDQTFLTFTQMRELNKRTPGIKGGTKEKKKAVLKALKDTKRETPETLKFMRYLQDMKHVLFNVKDKHRLNGCSRAVLVEMLHTSREISKHLAWVDYEIKKKEKND